MVAAIQGVVLVVAASGLLPDLGRSPPCWRRTRACSSRRSPPRFGNGSPAESGVRGAPSSPASPSCWSGSRWRLRAAVATCRPGCWCACRSRGWSSSVSLVLLPTGGATGWRVPFGLLAAILLRAQGAQRRLHRMVLDRPFDPVGDWGYLASAVGVLGGLGGSSDGRRSSPCCGGCLALALLVLLPLATRRVCRLARRHRRPSRSGSSSAWPRWRCCWVAGLTVRSDSLLSSASADLAVDEARDVRAGLHDRAVFAREIATDRFATRLATSCCRACVARTSCCVFVESYGRSAVRGQLLQPRHRCRPRRRGTVACRGGLPVPQRLPDLARRSAPAAGWRTRPRSPACG